MKPPLHLTHPSQWVVGVIDEVKRHPETGFAALMETKTRKQPTRPSVSDPRHNQWF